MNHRTNAPRRVPDGDACACECLVSVCPGEYSHIKQQVTLLTDDHGVRMLALAHPVLVIGRIGIVIRARLEGVMALYNLCSTSVSPQGSMWIRRATSPARRSSSPVRTAT